MAILNMVIFETMSLRTIQSPINAYNLHAKSIPAVNQLDLTDWRNLPG